ncbi:MAG: NAD(P)-dependent glycerol-3-phosphate dehydrogenase [Planctomycetes bacterium]|nr:NAD(P)-dependent glycerol-3-phosphate dehydrogenase [Planctomycetota bacterium]
MNDSTGRSLVLGDGGWGTAIALSLHRAGREVSVYSVDPAYAATVAETRQNSKFLPGVEIPESICWTGDRDQALEGATDAWSVIPTQFIRETVSSFEGRLAGLPMVSCSKGLELSSFQLPSQILVEAAGCDAGMGVLSGPSHAEETAFGHATSVVIAGQDSVWVKAAQKRIAGPGLRVYSSTDPTGVELGGALKNIIAVAAGVADGIGLGDNAKAALVARGLVEMARFGHSMGAQRDTFFGLSGAGDLMVTCYSEHSRNRGFGERIGRGETLEGIRSSTEKVAEGVWTCQAVYEIAHKQKFEMPITEVLFQMLFEGLAPAQAVSDLMTRPARSELDSSHDLGVQP